MAKKTNLFIPTKIKVGFQKRANTFTGKLAYIIYYDEKGVLRKEKSWTSWCDDSIDSIEFDNVPQTGFLFNKGVTRSHDWFGSGRSMVRVYDSRDFEFEITVDNLIGILMHSDVSKRDIVEPCVYAWAGTELVLLPINSQEYQDSLVYTEKQSNKISAKQLVIGQQYVARKTDTVYTYIGFFPYYDNGSWRSRSLIPKLQVKKHIFYNGKSFETVKVDTLSHCVSDEIDSNYADLVDLWYQSHHSSPIKSIEIHPYHRDTTNYRQGHFDTLFKLDGDRLTVVSHNWSNQYKFKLSADNTIWPSELIIREYAVNIANAEVKAGSVIRCKRCINTHNHWSNAGYTENHPVFQTLLASGKDELTLDEYYDIMEKEGYGNIKNILENGTIIDNVISFR
jgi:hypothetical protein